MLVATGVCCCHSGSCTGFRGSVLCATRLAAERQPVAIAAAAPSFFGLVLLSYRATEEQGCIPAHRRLYLTPTSHSHHEHGVNIVS